VDGGGWLPRPARFVATAARHPVDFARSLSVRRWSERTVIGLVMQSLDNSLTVSAKPHNLLRRMGFDGVGLTSRQGHGQPNPTWIPAGHDAIRRIARHLAAATGERAEPGGAIGDVVNVPMTAHFLGGCAIGESADAGVVDPYHRLHGYPGVSVVDGSTISANLGVNPALTITAQAERAMSLWPNAGEPDERPSRVSGTGGCGRPPLATRPFRRPPRPRCACRLWRSPDRVRPGSASGIGEDGRMSNRWTPAQLPDLTGRTAVVTGANSGVGLHTSLELARRGAYVVLACRDAGRGEQAVAEVRRQAPAAEVELGLLDLASLASVRTFAGQLLGSHPRLDILVNNAGVMALPTRQVTADASRCRSPPTTSATSR
jgi:hypothetical protein